MKGRSSEESNIKDKTLLETTRRVSLDAFWIRKPGTIKGNILMLRNMKGVDIRELVFEEWMPPLGPYPLTAEVGI